MHYGATPEIFRRAALLRRNMTFSERKLWNYLKKSETIGFKFRRQHPLSHFIVDFYCHSKKLIIEVDEEIHQNDEQLMKDALREEELKTFNLRILRFTNSEVDLFFDDVIIALNHALNS